MRSAASQSPVSWHRCWVRCYGNSSSFAGSRITDSMFGTVQVLFTCPHGFGELASNCSLLAGKHVKCDATDQWAKNESATVGSSLEETKLGMVRGLSHVK